MASGKKKKRSPTYPKKGAPLKVKGKKATSVGKASPSIRSSGFAGNPPGPKGAGLLLVGALALVAAGIFSLPNYHILLSAGGALSRWLVHPSLLLVGFLSLVWLFRELPDAPRQPEGFSGKWVAVWMALFSGLCFFSRFYHPEDPPSYVWDEHLIITGDIRNIIDFGYHPLIMANSSRPPFFPYLTALFWLIFPQASGMWIIRFTTVIIELANLWSLYALGTIVRGRRMGLILASLWALSQPGTFWSYCGYGMPILILGCVWIFICSYRLIEKPSMPRYIQLALVLAFGGYIGPYLRPFAPAVITLVLFWIFLKSKERLRGGLYWVLTLGLWVFWVFLFLFKNDAMPSALGQSLGANPLFWYGTIAGLTALYVKAFFETQKPGIRQEIVKWATLSGLTSLLMAPLLLDPIYSTQASAQSMLREKGISLFSLAAIQQVWLKILFFFQVTFLNVSGDVGIYPLPGHSFFESFAEFSMVVGLAYFIARPTLSKGYVIVIVLVGIAPFLATRFSHTGRLFGAIAPLLLMGGWGLDAYWDSFSREVKNHSARWLLFLLMLGFWAWNGDKAFGLCREWLARKTSNIACIDAQVQKDWKQYRVVVALHPSDFGGPTFSMLCDQKDVWLLTDPQPIYLEAGQTEKDIVLLVSGVDKTTQERVRKDFPSAQWQDVANLNGPRFMERILIPFDSLQERPGKMFYIQHVPANYWRRRFYWADYTYGLARGIVGWDDQVPSLNAPMPPGMNEHATVLVEGELTVPADGKYTLTLAPTVDRVLLKVDGKTIFDLKPGTDQALLGKDRIHLTSGTHRVSYATTFRRVLSFPDIHVAPADGGNEWLLGKSALDSQRLR